MSEQAIEMKGVRPRVSQNTQTNSVAGDASDKVVKSAGRVLRILEFFDVRREAASVIDVARALDVPQSSTSVLLRSLTLMGYLDYDPRSRTYRPTSRVAILGNWINPALVQRGGVLDAMRELHAKTGLTVLLAARNGLCTQNIHVVSREGEVSAHQVGMTTPLAQSAIGHLFLNLLSELEVTKLIRRVNAYAATDQQIVRMPNLLTSLTEIRKRGFAYHVSNGGAEDATMAMLLPSAPSPLALGMCGAPQQIEAACDDLVTMMRRQIAGLSQLSDAKSIYRS